MKNILLCFFTLFACTGLIAQERIAVFPFEDLDNVLTRNESVLLYREFSNEFTNRSAGKLNVVPRQEVDKLINTEAEFQLSDFSSRAKTAEMERVLNGTQILSGVIGKVGSRVTISVSLYTYPELVQQPGGTSLRIADIDELFDKIPELVQSMQSTIIVKQAASPIYKIGNRGPGGGIIFFAQGGQYMEFSQELGRAEWAEAKKAASNYNGGGFSNWHLPTRREWDLIRAGYGYPIKNASTAWSADEANRKEAYTYRGGSISKTNRYIVIAIRAFSQ